MEGSVWSQLSALVAAIASLLSKFSPSQQNQSNGGELQNAPAKVADLISTSPNVTSPVLRVIRNPAMTTEDALFGDMIFREERICFTMERTAVAIPEGTYLGCKRDSQHFGRKVVGISVPNRTDIECHPANHPCQLEGCIAVGESIDNDALDNSTAAFDEMMSELPQKFTVVIE